MNVTVLLTIHTEKDKQRFLGRRVRSSTMQERDVMKPFKMPQFPLRDLDLRPTPRYPAYGSKNGEFLET